MASHPSRVRGLKFPPAHQSAGQSSVAPLAGAWIEMIPFLARGVHILVAPRAGAWIEIKSDCVNSVASSSRTPRGCVD